MSMCLTVCVYTCSGGGQQGAQRNRWSHADNDDDDGGDGGAVLFGIAYTTQCSVRVCCESVCVCLKSS